MPYFLGGFLSKSQFNVFFCLRVFFFHENGTKHFVERFRVFFCFKGFLGLFEGFIGQGFLGFIGVCELSV